MSIQGSPEWFAERLGKATASRVADIVAKTKTGYGTSRANYLAELVVERLTGQRVNGYTNTAMQHGIAFEPVARLAYEFREGATVEECGFIPHPTIPMCGASPDGLVGSDGLLEIKCPATATHIETLLSGTIAGKYLTQMQFQMACTDRMWCDFVSFDPRMPEHLRYWCKRVERDINQIDYLEREVDKFLGELDETIKRLEAL
jgi:putative phage-type endonuclease